MPRERNRGDVKAEDTRARGFSPGARFSPRAVRLALPASPRVARLCTALLSLTLACGLWCAGASALASQGHVFDTSFGSPGAGEDQLNSPSDLAVGEAEGLVYVSDTGNNRVEVFKRIGGTFEYLSAFAVRDPGPIAVDNSSSPSDPTHGQVYVAGADSKEEAEEGERNTLYVYSPSAGEVTQKIHAFKSQATGEELEEEFEGGILGVAVDQSGMLWVYWEEEGIIDAFHKGLSAKGSAKLEWQPALRRSLEERFECYARPAFALAPEDAGFYAGYERRNENGECPGERDEGQPPDPTVVAKLDGSLPAPATLIGELDHRDTTGATTDPNSGEVYLDNVSSVGAYSSEGVPIERFGEGHMSAAAGIALDASTDQIFVADTTANQVVVFDPDESSGAPIIDSVTSENLTPSSAALHAQIDPHGLQSTYRFEYGTQECGQPGADCLSTAQATIPAGHGDVSVSAQVSALTPASAYHLRLIASNASGEAEGEPSPSTFQTLPSPGVLPDGRDWELVSPANKHDSSVELISGLRSGSIQASRDGSRLAWLAAGPAVEGPEGSRAFELSQMMSERTRAGWTTASLETPHTSGWGLLLPSPGEYHFFTSDLSSALVEPTEWDDAKTEGVVEHPPLSPQATEKTIYLRPNLPEEHPTYTPLVTAENDTAGTKFGGSLGFEGASSDLSEVVFSSQVGLTDEGATTGGLYVWQGGKSLELLSVLPNETPAPNNEFVEPALGAAEGLDAREAISQDGRRIVWSDGVGLYLRDTLLDKTIRINAAQGNEAVEPGPEGQTVPEPPEEEHPSREVRYQGASSDGKRVFFTDTARLTEDSTQEPVGEESPADLYEFELASENPLRGRLYDLTTYAPGTSADVLSVIPGNSEDGSAVYFVANGVLAPGAKPGLCSRNLEQSEPAPSAPTCNLYLSEEVQGHPGARQTRFIAALSAQDGADWAASPTTELARAQRNLASLTARVSPNGRYLAFMSQQPLTGYDNRETENGQPVEEVYLYDAASGRLTCVSCNSNEAAGGWTRPLGIFDTEQAGEGLGLLVDRPEVWSKRWLSASIPGWDFNRNYSNAPAALYQPRYLSNSGRLFFDSADALVKQDVNGKMDIYEYEPGGIGTCASSGGCVGLISSGTSDHESAFLDASESGEDVFFATAAPLVGIDTDNSLDIYDAHVCTAESPCLLYPEGSKNECDGSSECRPETFTPPSVTLAATAAYSGPGNPPSKPAQQKVAATKTNSKPKVLTRAQKLARALKRCRTRYKHSTRKRHGCERLARGRYAPPHRTAKKSRIAHETHRVTRPRGRER